MQTSSSISGEELVPIVQNSNNRTVTIQKIKEGLATVQQLEGKVDNSEIADMLTKTEAASTYQPKGDYLTAIPDEYVTETELSSKNYALKSEVPDVSNFITSTQADGKYATLGQIGDIDAILDSINGQEIS